MNDNGCTIQRFTHSEEFCNVSGLEVEQGLNRKDVLSVLLRSEMPEQLPRLLRGLSDVMCRLGDENFPLLPLGISTSAGEKNPLK